MIKKRKYIAYDKLSHTATVETLDIPGCTVLKLYDSHFRKYYERSYNLPFETQIERLIKEGWEGREV